LWLVVQMQQLQHEITRMRAQQDSLKKKIKETTEKFEDEHDIHLKNMAALKKESENQMKHVRELEVQVPYKGRVTVSACLLPYSFSRPP
jgi:seryl-tRNA synthetase